MLTFNILHNIIGTLNEFQTILLWRVAYCTVYKHHITHFGESGHIGFGQ